MNAFFQDFSEHAFIRNSLLMGLLAAVACGTIGSYVVVRRITYVAGGIAHCVLGGMGAAHYLRVVYGWEFLHPTYGAIVAALLSAMIIGWVSLRARQREDTVIGALWAIGMAVGILFISRTPGYNQDLMSYLFGNILMVSPADLKLVAGLDLLIVVLVLAFYNPLLAVCYDEEFARLRGVKVETYYLLLLCLTALTVVLLITVVGIVLVIALLTLPVAIAGHFVTRLWGMIVVSILLSMFFTTLGLAVSYGPNLPAGATTIILAGGAYLIVTIYKAMRRTNLSAR